MPTSNLHCYRVFSDVCICLASCLCPCDLLRKTLCYDPSQPPLPMLRHSCQSKAIFIVIQWFIKMFLNWFNKWNQTTIFFIQNHVWIVSEQICFDYWPDQEELWWRRVGILEIFVFAKKPHLINLTHSSLSSDRSWQYAILENLRKLIVISFANIICSQWAQCIFTTQFQFPLFLKIHNNKTNYWDKFSWEISGCTILWLISIQLVRGQIAI